MVAKLCTPKTKTENRRDETLFAQSLECHGASRTFEILAVQWIRRILPGNGRRLEERLMIPRI